MSCNSKAASVPKIVRDTELAMNGAYVVEVGCPIPGAPVLTKALNYKGEGCDR
jgi:hypothetical protein